MHPVYEKARVAPVVLVHAGPVKLLKIGALGRDCEPCKPCGYSEDTRAQRSVSPYKQALAGCIPLHSETGPLQDCHAYVSPEETCGS